MLYFRIGETREMRLGEPKKGKKKKEYGWRRKERNEARKGKSL